MLRVNWPVHVVDTCTIHPSSMFATGVKIKATGELNLNDSPDCKFCQFTLASRSILNSVVWFLISHGKKARLLFHVKLGLIHVAVWWLSFAVSTRT